MTFDKITVPSPKECFFEDMKTKILTGELAVGQRLPSERALAQQTGINQSAVHLAIKDLERTGFLRIVPRHGTYVCDFITNGNYDTLHEMLKNGRRQLTAERITELIETRNALEGGAMIRLAEKHSPSDIQILKRHIMQFKKVQNDDIGAAELGKMTRDFHFLICRLSGNEVIILLMNSFSEISDDLWRHCAGHWGVKGLIEQSEHIVRLIEQRKGLEAQVYITEKFNEYVRDCGIDL